MSVYISDFVVDKYIYKLHEKNNSASDRDIGAGDTTCNTRSTHALGGKGTEKCPCLASVREC